MNQLTNTFRRLSATVGTLVIACTGCAFDASRDSLDDEEIGSVEQAIYEHSLVGTESLSCDDVTVTVTQTGTNEYTIVAETYVYNNIETIWSKVRNFKTFVEVALPGVATNFQWICGGPHQIPSTFKFTTSGEIVKEEIYYRSEYKHKLRYRVLEPALGILEYDSIIDLDPVWSNKTHYKATRFVTLEPGALEGLVDLFELETGNIKDYFEPSVPSLNGGSGS